MLIFYTTLKGCLFLHLLLYWHLLEWVGLQQRVPKLVLDPDFYPFLPTVGPKRSKFSIIEYNYQSLTALR